MADDRPIEEILDVLGDDQARAILAALEEEPQSANELADRLELSLPTVYRRIDRLEEHGLVEHKSIISTDGNHYNVYACEFDSAVVLLRGGEYDVEVLRHDSIPDRSGQLREEIRRRRTG